MSNVWFQTIKGNQFFLLDPKPDSFDLEEIAHALALQCRFNGHVKFHYSVAEHSVLVSELLEEWGEPREVQLCGLLHDACEAYIGDIVSPLKSQLAVYRDIESHMENVMAHTFGIPWPFPSAVKRADRTLLEVERRGLLEIEPFPWDLPEDIVLPDWTLGQCEVGWRLAKDEFLKRYEELNA